MLGRAGGGEAHGTRLDRLLDDVSHELQVLVGDGRVDVHGTLSEAERPHGPVRDLGGKVHAARLGLQRVQVLRERLPLPVDAGVQGRAWDVLDPFLFQQPRE